MLIDTHAHLQSDDFEVDRSEVVMNCKTNNLAVINIGTTYNDSEMAVKLASENNNFYATIGVHPTEIFESPFNEEVFQKLLTDKVVAVGEVGLDLWHLDWIREKYNLTDEQIYDQQLLSFENQLNFAKKNNLAVVIHGRNGEDGPINVYEIILDKLVECKIERAVFHCYSGDEIMANKIIKHGYYLGFDGPITFKKNESLREMIKSLPIENILAETDCPYLAPEPVRGKRNEPVYVKHIIAKISEIKGLDYQEIEDELWENAKKLFRIT